MLRHDSFLVLRLSGKEDSKGIFTNAFLGFSLNVRLELLSKDKGERKNRLGLVSLITRCE